MLMALTVPMLLDSLAIRIDGPRAWDADLTIDLVVTEPEAERARHRLTLHHGALTHRETAAPRTPPGLVLTLTKRQLLGVLAGQGAGGIATEGDPALLERLFSFLTKPDPNFPIVTP
ncbi:alkyl sulfatase C-terminal domain-containing protein [Streptomyces bikiniensis]|uniref:Alkyl sulfatase C-terminal domain-containing protein n=1 Tax=Streptomyces bikiniensis TaxID=1896 RepID=A0ABW8CQB7_STRBI